MTEHLFRGLVNPGFDRHAIDRHRRRARDPVRYFFQPVFTQFGFL
ncbi:MAG: hypothetical protein ACR2M3_13335 [Thermomicrobiales bacterium]